MGKVWEWIGETLGKAWGRRAKLGESWEKVGGGLGKGWGWVESKLGKSWEKIGGEPGGEVRKYWERKRVWEDVVKNGEGFVFVCHSSWHEVWLPCPTGTSSTGGGLAGGLVPLKLLS